MTINLNNSIKSTTLASIKSVSDIDELKSLLESIETEEKELEVNSIQFEPTSYCISNNNNLKLKLKEYNSLKDEFVDCYDNINNINVKTKTVLKPILELIREQDKIKEAIGLIKQTQLLENEYENLVKNFTNKDLEASYMNSFNFIKLNPKQIINSPLKNYLRQETIDGFESYRLKMLLNLTEQLNSENNKVIDALHKFPLVDEMELGLQATLTFFTNLYKNFVSELSNDKTLTSVEIISKSLEFGIQKTLELIDLIEASYTKDWKLQPILPFLKNLHVNLIPFILKFKLDNKLEVKLNFIHNSFYKNHKATATTYSPNNTEVSLTLVDCDFLLNSLANLCQKFQLFEIKLNQLFKDRTDGNEKVNLPKDLFLTFQPILEAYPLIEKYYFDKSVEKAAELDEYENGNFNSTFIDDLFFLTKKSMFRSMTSCHSLTFNLSLKIYIDQLKHLQFKYQTNLMTQQDTETKVKLLALNNCLATSKYLKKLLEDMQVVLDKLMKPDKFDSEVKEKFTEGLNLLKPFIKSFNTLNIEGLNKLVDTAIENKVEAFFNQLSNEVNYNLVADGMQGNLQGNETLSPIATKLPTRFTLFLQPFQNNLNEPNYNKLVLKISDIVAKQLFALITQEGRKFNVEGVMRLENDVSISSSYFDEIVDSGDEEEPFFKCFKLVELLQCEMEEEFRSFIEENQDFCKQAELPVLKQLLMNRADLDSEVVNKVFS